MSAQGEVADRWMLLADFGGDLLHDVPRAAWGTTVEPSARWESADGSAYFVRRRLSPPASS